MYPPCCGVNRLILGGLALPEEDASRLFKAVNAIAISPADALKIVEKYRQQSQKKYPNDTPVQHQERIAKKIISRYTKLAAMAGVVSSLPGAVPGLGTAIAMTGGVFADIMACMKLQVDMCFCLAAVFNYDLCAEDTRHLAFLLAAGGVLEGAGAEGVAKVASTAGVRLVRQYLKGAVLKTIKELFKRIGIIFTRKALEKAVPFLVGTVVGGVANKTITSIVGNQAKQWFEIDQVTLPEDADAKEGKD